MRRRLHSALDLQADQAPAFCLAESICAGVMRAANRSSAFAASAFAAITTLYLVVAIPLEERSLRRAFGDDYIRYAREVRWRMLPFIY